MGIFGRKNEFGDIERRLQASRPQPKDDLLSRVEGLVDEGAAPADPPGSRARARLAVAGGLTLALALPLAAIGILGQSSTAVSQAGSSAKRSVEALVTQPAKGSSNAGTVAAGKAVSVTNVSGASSNGTAASTSQGGPTAREAYSPAGGGVSTGTQTAAINRYLAQLTLDLPNIDFTNWPYTDSNGNPDTTRLLWYCTVDKAPPPDPLTAASPWTLRSITYADWSSTTVGPVIGYNSGQYDKGYWLDTSPNRPTNQETCRDNPLP